MQSAVAKKVLDYVAACGGRASLRTVSRADLGFPRTEIDSAVVDLERGGLLTVQPTPGGSYSLTLPEERLPVLTRAQHVDQRDTAAALDELQAWLERNPTGRSVWVIDKIKGKWRVGLQCDAEHMSASQDAELRGAIRNAIMIASYAGYK